MRSRRSITGAIACIAALSAAMPAAAPASSLLSGYGGPGQGSQVILGSSLVNGPPKGGGGSQGGGGSTGAGESSTAVTGGLGTRAGSGSKAPTGSVAHKPASGGHGKKAKGRAVGGSSSGSRSSRGEAAVRPAAAGSETLGVSGMDLVYILAGLGALILTAVLTKRIAHTSPPAESAGS